MGGRARVVKFYCFCVEQSKVPYPLLLAWCQQGGSGVKAPGTLSRTLPGTGLTSYEHIGAGSCGALDPGLDVLVVAAVAARVVGVSLGQQQHLAVGPSFCAFTVLHNPCVFTVLPACGQYLLGPWPGPLKGVLPPSRE